MKNLFLLFILFFAGCSYNEKNIKNNSDLDDDILKNTTINLVYSILSNVSSFQVQYMYQNEGEILENVIFECDGIACSTNIHGEKYNLNISDFIPKSGKIYIDGDSNVSILEPLVINGYSCYQDAYKNINCEK